jgi:starch phosphorylase
MKSSIAKLCPEFNMQRMAMQYAQDSYLTAHRRFRSLNATNSARAKDLAAWLRKVESEWPRVSVESTCEDLSEINLGEEVQVLARVTLNSLSPDDVEVQVLTGLVDAEGNLKDPVAIPMRTSVRETAGVFRFQTIIQTSARSGLHGYAIRILPTHADSFSPFLPGLIKWAQATSPVAELQAH